MLNFEKNKNMSVNISVHDSEGLFTMKEFVIEIQNVIEDRDGDGIEDVFDDDNDNDGIIDIFDLDDDNDRFSDQKELFGNQSI